MEDIPNSDANKQTKITDYFLSNKQVEDAINDLSSLENAFYYRSIPAKEMVQISKILEIVVDNQKKWFRNKRFKHYFLQNFIDMLIRIIERTRSDDLDYLETISVISKHLINLSVENLEIYKFVDMTSKLFDYTNHLHKFKFQDKKTSTIMNNQISKEKF